ncbi:A/G-specific adenine glycosylase [Sphingomonas lutea]|uniref:Adenine DNA glycosylase n=2 Tax=Sphingomonas lutea TaxID=1045317 RepID=A0A7G9SKZ7_9SPHN|nr:A/G-specific adenine glycosylase [Sphingomonas lutea]
MDPYRVWLSEVMLQQTTVAAVTPRFERFVTKWPTVEALAAADDADVFAEWAGLGYYARARNLLACARKVAARGGFPASAADLRGLPGIGPYTASAIAAIAFGEAAPAIDTNIRRVIARLHALERPSDAEIEALLGNMIPAGRAGDFIQALMDLGATICRARAPRCDHCPLRTDCQAFATGQPEAFPAPKIKTVRPQRYGIAWWIERDGAVWLVRRPHKGLLGGMAALPSSDWGDSLAPDVNALSMVRHVFTHFALDLKIVRAGEPIGEGWWHPVDRLADAGLPTLFKRAAALAVAARRPCAAA